MRAFLLVLLFLGTVPVQADILYLRDGREIEGFIESAEDVITIRTESGMVERVPATEVKKMEVGYSGLALCYRLQGSLRETCAGILHRLGPDGVVVGRGRGNTTGKEFSLASLSRVSFKKQPGQKIIPVLHEGLTLTLQTTGGDVTGTIRSRSDSRLELELPAGGTRNLTEAEIEGGLYEKPSHFSMRQLVPGYPQYLRGELKKSAVIWGGMGAAGAFGLWEFVQAATVNQNASRSLSFQLFNDPGYQSAFETHQKNQMLAGGLAAIVYGFHLYDAFRAGPAPTQTSPSPGLPHATWLWIPDGRHAQVSFALTWNF